MPDILIGLSQAFAGRYRIERELGAGGMATVYLAHDLKHDRDVAIKILRPEVAVLLGAERFLAEIRITARLDHPHILTLIDSGTADGLPYYVLPYVRGESLRRRLERERQLPLADALAITRQVASAVDYAHRQGVIHRDIKPENILIQEGEAMLTDFGIALAVEEAGGEHLTGTGLHVGTPQYMSPEQAMGDRQVDGRSDVYSLAAVLYEMLAGEPPHTGRTAQSVVAKLLADQPVRLRHLRTAVPLAVDVAVARALDKTPADRYQSAGDFAAALQANPKSAAPARRRRTRRVVAGAAVLLVAVMLAAYWRVSRHALTLKLGRSDQVTAEPGLEIQPAISLDGRLVAYAGGSAGRMRIYLRPVDGGRNIPLSDDSSAAESQPRWAPDGRSLLFLARGGVSVVPALGGSSRPVVPDDGYSPVFSADWSPDGKEIAFAHGDSLLRKPVAGGPAILVGTATKLHSCAWSPAGTWIACASMNPLRGSDRNFGNLAPSALLLFPSRGGSPRVLAEPVAANLSPTWLPDGRHLLFISDRDGPRDIYVLRISSSGSRRGDPVRLTTGLGAMTISLDASGKRLAYATYLARSNIWSLPIPATPPTDAEAAIPVTRGSQVIEGMNVSRDGRWLLYDSNLRGNSDIYRVPIGGGQAERLTAAPAAEFGPDLSPDGRWLAYHSWRNGTRDIEVKPLDGGAVEEVTDTPAQESYPAWFPDGRTLVFFEQAEPWGLKTTRRQEDGTWSAPVTLDSLCFSPQPSPDGRWIACLNRSGTIPGFVRLIPQGGGASRSLLTEEASIGYLDMIRWGPDGRHLYLKGGDTLGHSSFWDLSPEGEDLRLLVSFRDPDWQSHRPEFATDGRRFFFTVQDRQSDVFVVEVLEQ